ncbi:IPT/TIG domain-containing protein [Tenacibaculum tangerinum]|uniref:IPT/TIG domain-containing protein n=1 Tax=Tenacibaculum tangerinum TaxID=3038772 RepID=A0ABY8L322_9FLAO|nr:IPT/TIG domain-containing protein [Tenacibaculum tangerinum]WGH75666.1 IPT/TIG domain-containing protein [Tenacibaculum tangerinum]
MKTEILLVLIIFNLISSSCSNGDAESEITPTPPPVLKPEIESLSSNFIIEGQTLVIKGLNFKSNESKTTVIINNKSYDITPTANEISIKINAEMGVEKSSLNVQVGAQKSTTEYFFIMPKKWHKIETQLEILKAFIFDDTNEITLLEDTDASSNSYYGAILKLKTSENGYLPESLNIPGGNKSDLKMYNSQTGVAASSITGYFTSDGFQNSTAFGSFLDTDAYVDDVKIVYVDETSSIIVNCCADYMYTNDKGITFEYSSVWKELSMGNNIRFWSSNKLSDGYFYGAGLNAEKSPNANLILKSADGISNWEILDDVTTPYSIGSDLKMLDTDLFLQVFHADKQLQKSNDLAKTWVVVRSDVEKVFTQNKTNWYVLSVDSKLYSTNDSGNTWKLELELPSDSKINHMSFSENKILLSGDNLLYIKHL